MTKTPKQSQQPDVQTTGHSWDGISEYNNPLPRWWLWTFYASIIWALGYTIAMPAWPLLNGATPGILGKSTRADVAAEIARYDAANAGIEARLMQTDLAAVPNDPELVNYTQNAGRAVFQTWCAQCHGAGGGGQQGLGYPNLLDSDWLWGGTVDDIHFTITHGIRNEDDPDEEARFSQMPAFGTDDLLDNTQIAQVVHYVRLLSGQGYDADLATPGAAVYADNCASCHMEDGTGDRAQGAPNLTDAIWLYGGDVATLTKTVHDARFGVMPNWNTRLSQAEIRAVAAYVHALGGGE
ncbi:cytochrome-c oxidase, cbb3-type subunit III [Thioclava sp. SK-1]|uniref:cytochrome-c oxidase, cbb3-type subunit III n=1 Tax=Thioclava sp. SK-1 TaxID=1889770 RepID=UPI000826532D|nr:cytochrome-c oxidase, cbb3-type subunit III [Thioclava sp. SK-1]OCX66665.1 cytochrome-c oxidase, cbb3-type subunit III [Thioclava sp. SK-1]